MTKKARLIIAGCLSAGLHLFVVVPFGIARLLIDTSPELAVTFIEADDGPAADAPALTDKPEPEKPKLAEADKPKPEPEKEPPEPAAREEKQKPEEREAPKPPPLVVIPDAHLKMVDQEQFPDEADNPDAHYLAQKNHR